jgi:hypothetical protein
VSAATVNRRLSPRRLTPEEAERQVALRAEQGSTRLTLAKLSLAKRRLALGEQVDLDAEVGDVHVSACSGRCAFPDWSSSPASSSRSPEQRAIPASSHALVAERGSARRPFGCWAAVQRARSTMRSWASGLM